MHPGQIPVLSHYLIFCKKNSRLTLHYNPRAQFWMDLFGDLRDSGEFTGSDENQGLLRFCRKTWMNAPTSGTSTRSDHPDLHHVLGAFQTNCISCLTGNINQLKINRPFFLKMQCYNIHCTTLMGKTF